MQRNAYDYSGVPGEPDAALGIWRNGDETTRLEPGFSSHVFTAVPAPAASALLAIAGFCRRAGAPPEERADAAEVALTRGCGLLMRPQ